MKKLALIITAALALALFAGCAAQTSGAISENAAQTPLAQSVSQTASAAQSGAEGESASAVTFTDALNNEVTVESPKAVAALSGSLAETWLLAGGTLAAVTQDAIDERDLDLGEDIINVGSLKTPSAEQIIASGADFVILSADITGQVEMHDTLAAAGVNCAYFSVEIFEDYLEMLKICTEITGRADLYKENGTDIQLEIDKIRAAVKGETPPEILLIRAYSTGAKIKDSENMTGAMLKDLGCVNIADSDKSLLEDLSLEKIIEADPDFIFVTTMGDSDEALSALAQSLLDNPAWGELSAVKENHYIVLPTELYHYKPNALWGQAYANIAQILYGYEA